MKKWIQTSLILFSISFSSCGVKNKENIISSIDNLLYRIEKSDSTIDHLYQDKVLVYSAKIDSSINSIKSNYSDSIIWHDAKTLSKYNRIIKSFNYHLKKSKYLKNQLAFSLSQVQNLKTDIKNNSINLDSISSYYTIEYNIVKKIDSSIANQKQFIRTKISEYKTTKLEVEEIVFKLQQ